MEYDWKGKQILVADDERLNFILLNGLLRNTNAEIHWAENGEDAINACRNLPIDLILMDLRMPIVNGLEATRAIKAISPETLIIVQTSFNQPEDETGCMLAGCDAFITKPIDRDNVLMLIDNFFKTT